MQRDKKKEKPRNSRSSQNINNLNLNNASNGGAHNNGKDDKKEDPRSAREKKVTRANCFAELSEELQKKIKKAKLHEDEVNKQFWVLLNVLHFITKESYRMEGQDSPPVQRRRPYAPVKSIEAASECSIYTAHTYIYIYLYHTYCSTYTAHPTQISQQH